MSSWCGQVMTENWGRLERIDDLRLTNSQEYYSARSGSRHQACGDIFNVRGNVSFGTVALAWVCEWLQ